MLQLSNQIFNFLTKGKKVSSQEKEWYMYVIESFITKFIASSVIVILGAIFWNMTATIIFLISTIQMRKHSNGYHAEKFWKCFILSNTLSVTLFLFIEIPIISKSIVLKCAILLLSSIMIMCSKDSNIIRKKMFEKQLVIFLIITLLSYTVNVIIIGDAVLLSVVFTAITIVPNIFITKKEKL